MTNTTEETTTYHVSAVYEDVYGLETFSEFTVEADSGAEAIEMAKGRPGANEVPDDAEWEVV